MKTPLYLLARMEGLFSLILTPNDDHQELGLSKSLPFLVLCLLCTVYWGCHKTDCLSYSSLESESYLTLGQMQLSIGRVVCFGRVLSSILLPCLYPYLLGSWTGSVSMVPWALQFTFTKVTFFFSGPQLVQSHLHTSVKQLSI